MTSAPFIEVKNLRRVFDVSKPWLNRVLEGGHLEFLKAVDGVTFDITKGETFALVGESGSGKTTVARMVVGLLPPTSGEVVIDGVSMSDARQLQARQQLRRRIQMIFQDPYASLNPRLRVDAIVAEPIRAFDLIQGERNIRARASANCSAWSACIPTTAGNIRTDFPAASGNASRSRAHSHRRPNSSSATNRLPRSMSRCRLRSSI